MKENNKVVSDKKEINKPIEEQTLVERLRIRASIRRNNTERKSVKEGKPDRISDLLEEAANEIERLNTTIEMYRSYR